MLLRQRLPYLTKILILLPFVFFILQDKLSAQCPNPADLDFTISDQRCVGDPVTFSSFVSGNATDNYEIITEGDTIRSAPFDYTYSTAGTKSVIFRRITTDGCSDMISRNILVNDLPAVDFTFSSDNTNPPCSGTLINFTGTSSASNRSFLWDFDDGSTSDQQSPSHVFEAFGNSVTDFSVTLTVTDEDTGCSASITKSVNIREAPQVVLLDEFGGPIDEFNNCNSASQASPDFAISFNDNSSPDVVGYTVDWGDGSPVFTGNSPPSGHTYNTLDVFRIDYTVEGANGCSTTREISVLNITNPGVGIESLGNTIDCSPLDVTFEINFNDANHSSTTYTVNFGDDSESQIFSHPPPVTVSHIYNSTSCGLPEDSFEAEIVAANACSNTPGSVGGIKVYTPPQAEFEPGAEIVCAGTSLVFTNTTIAGSNSTCSGQTRYIWDYGDGSADTVFSQANVSHIYTAAGEYKVTLVAGNTCDDSVFEQNVTVCDEAPQSRFTATFNGTSTDSGPDCDDSVVQIDLPAGACPPVTLDLTNNSVIPCMDSLLWTVDAIEGFLFSNGETTSGARTEQITFSRGGTYICKFTVRNACGVSESCLKFVINDQPSLPVISGNATDYCENSLIDLQAAEDASIDSYRWEVTGINGTEDPSLAVDTNVPDLEAFTLSSGTYNVKLIITNVCGESETDEIINVNQAPEAVINAGADATLCAGESVLLEVTEVPGATYEWRRNGEVLSGQVRASLNATEAGEYEVTVSDGICQTTSDAVTVTGRDGPEIQIETDDRLEFCEGEAIQVNFRATDDPGFSYQWLRDGIEIAGATGSLFEADAAGEYAVQISDDVCPGLSNSLNIIVNDLPVLTVNRPESDLCFGDSVTISVTGAASYQWSPSAGLLSQTGTDNRISPPDSTQYTIVGTDTNNCVASTNFLINVKPLPVLVTNVNDDRICSGEETTITVSGADTYTWSPSQGLSTTEGNIVIAEPNETTTYRVIGENEFQCIDSAFATVNIDRLPDLNAGADRVICIDNGLINLFNNEGLNPGGGTWTGPGLDAAANFDPQASGEGTFSFQYQVTDPESGCENIDEFLLTVEPVPATEFLTPDQVCRGLAVPFENLTPVTGQSLNFAWDFGDGSNSSETSPSYEYLATGIFSVSLVATNSVTGCEESFQRTIEVIEPPVAEFSRSITDDIFCGPVSITFEDLSTGDGLAYQWDFGNGVTSTEQTPGDVTFIPNLFQDTAYVVSLRVNNGLTICEEGVFTDTIRISPNPTARFQFQQPVCADFPVTFNNSSFGAPERFVWDFGDGSESVETDNMLDLTHTFSNDTDQDTTFSVQLIVSNTCRSDTTVRDIIVSPNEVNAFYETDEPSGCVPHTVSLTSNQIIESNNEIIWDMGDGTIILDSLSVNYTYTEAGTFTPSLIVRNGCNVDTCSFNTNPACGQIITVSEGAVAAFETEPVVCLGEALVFNNLSSSGINNMWDFGDGNTFTGTDPGPYTYDSAGQYTISLTVENINRCVSPVFSRTVIVDELPVAGFEFDRENQCEGDEVLMTNTSVEATSYRWAVAPSGFTSSAVSPAIPFSDAGRYEIFLTAINENNCENSSTEAITIGEVPDLAFAWDTTGLECGAYEIEIFNQSRFSENQASVYEWQLNGSVVSTGDGDFSSTVENLSDEPLEVVLTLTVESLNACREEISETITIPPFVAKVFVPENVVVAITPEEATNNRFRLNYKNVETYALSIFNRWGNVIFQTDDPDEAWDGHYNGQVAEPGSYLAQVTFTDCRDDSETVTRQIELLVLKRK